MGNERQLIRCSQVEPKPLEWLWPGYLAVGALHDFSGDPGQGKSRVCYDLAARLSSGQPLPGCGTAYSPAGVVLLQGEDDVAATVRPALASAGADLDRVFVYDPASFPGPPLSLPGDLPLLEEAAA